MLLGGFLKQMNDTIRYNLDLRERLKRKPANKPRKTRKQHIQDTKSFNETERKQLLLALNEAQKEERRKRLKALFISILLTILIFSVFWWIFS
ncbi:MAG: hypothetical protein ACK4RF_07155 [Cyclobacteriaceae bacterium]